MKQRLIHAAAAALALGAVATAHAEPTLSISADGITVTCVDNAACDTNSALGEVTYIGTVGAFKTNITTGLSKPSLSGGNPAIDLNSVDVESSDGVHTLVIKFSDTSFDLQGYTGLEFGGVLSGTGAASATITATGYADSTNTIFGASTLLGQLGPYGQGAFSGSYAGILAPTSLYSLTEVLTLTTKGAGQTTFTGDFEVNVAEPNTLALLGLGLFAFGVVPLRRRRRAA